PGPEIAVKPVEMKFSFTDAFPPEPEEAYGRLLLDVMRGDHTLFVRQDGVERAWQLVEPLIQNPPPICYYQAGTWGPEEANTLIEPETWNLR
ncbi:MAG: glucose-6-phosphate dehydrogenase, partial [Candidatus Obscuribacterales bacterium]